VSNRRTRANSAPLNARVTLELANRLRQHLAEHGCGNLSDFVSAAIEEKLAREALYTQAAQSTAARQFDCNWQDRKADAGALSLE
jgi:hypothetical protein